MKWILSIFILLLIFPIFSGVLVTGKQKMKYEPGDKVLINYTFQNCPVGEIPEGFDKINGAVECVRLDDQIWVAPSTDSDLRLYKKINLGNNDFSLEFDLITYQEVKGALGTTFIIRFLESRGKEWDKAKLPYDITLKTFYNKMAIKLENVGDIGKIENIYKKKLHFAIQIRRRQFRVFVDGKRLVCVPFNVTPNENLSGFEFMFTEDTNAYGTLLSNIKVTKYTQKEKKPSPKKLGVKIEELNSEIKLTMSEKILFDYNKFILKSDAIKVLNVVGNFIKIKDYKKILVIGYTDNIGSDAYNLKLSLQRAQSVADYLIYCSKINPSKIEIKGMGEKDPIADNNTPEGRAKNRRVVIKILM